MLCLIQMPMPWPANLRTKQPLSPPKNLNKNNKLDLCLQLALRLLLLFLLLLAGPGTVAAQQSVGVRLSLNLLSLTEQADPTGNNITVTATLRGDTRTEATVVTLALATSRPTSPFLLPGLTLATQGTDYTTTLSSTNNSMTIASGETSATTTFAIDPTLDTAVEADETIIVTGSGTNLDVLPTELMLTDGPYLTFATPLDAQVLYRGADLTSSSITLPSATSPLSGTVTYQVTSDPATPDNGLEHTQPGDKLGPGTLSGTLASTNSTTRYTITATHAGTMPAATATARVSISVVEDQCSTTTDDWKGSITTPGAGLIKDCNILLAAKDTLRGTAGGSLNWATSQDITTWTGLSSVEAGGVKWIYLDNSSLKGTIPRVLGGLAILGRLSLVSNQLTGAIPWELGDLTNLDTLFLHLNQLSGPIPSALGALQNLWYLNLTANSFTHIPPALGDLKKLTQLSILNNPLTGAIPWELGRLTKLTHLWLNYDSSLTAGGRNRLTGAIPRSLGRLTKLKHLHLESNQLSGSIPPELGNLTSLQQFYLWDNQLSGAIPPELGKLASLQHLRLGGNQLSGAIPKELGNLTNSLTWLLLHDNRLSGAIPKELGNLTSLQYFYLYNNQLSGAIPKELGNLTGLYWLFLNNNALSGTVPSELGSLTGLTYFYLHDNQLEGSLPATFTNLALNGFFFDYNESLCLPASLDNEWYDTLYFYPGYQDTVEVHCAFATPAAPTSLTPGPASLTANWDAYSNTGFTTSRYEVQYRAGTTGKWRTVPHDTSHPTSATTYTITGLTPGQSHQVRYRALDDIAGSTRYRGTTWSSLSSATVPPVKLTVSVSGNSVTLSLTNWPTTRQWWYQGGLSTRSPSGCIAGEKVGTPTPIGSLSAGPSYTYTAYSDATCSTKLASQTFTTSPPALVVRARTETTATLSLTNWRSFSGWYYQRRQPTVGPCVQVVSEYTVTLSKLTPGTAYTYTAYSNACSNSLASQTFTTLGTAPVPDDGTDDGPGVGSGGGTGGSSPPPSALRNFFESPVDGAVVSGIDLIRGWSFAEEAGVTIERVDLYLDGRRHAVIPCCSARADVSAQYPNFPRANTGQSGWGIIQNWGNLPAGSHTVRVVTTSSQGEQWRSPIRRVTVVKPGDIAFADRFALAEAEARLDGQHLVLDGVVIRDKASKEEQEISARYAWQTGAQGVRLEASRTLETARTLPWSLERLLAGVWHWLSPHSVTATDGLTKDYEAPADQARVAGIGLIRGWAFPDEPRDTIDTVSVQIGPTLRESAPCCSTRPDVAAAFPDQANAELSGWGLVFNYGRLPEGEHSVTAQITTTAGLTHTETHSAVVARLGGYEFVNRFDLSGAEVEVVGEEIILSGVEVRDSTTQETQTIEVRLRWSPAMQGLVIVDTETVP